MKFFGLFSHWLSNFVGMLGPILVLPHQLKVLGANEYGYLMATQYVAIQILPIVDFGLSYAGPNWLKKQEKNSHALLLTVLCAAFISWTIGLVIGLIYFSINGSGQAALFILIHLTTLSYVMPPAYFILQNGGQVKYGIAGVVVKSITIVWAFVALKSPSDINVWAFGAALIACMQSAFFLKLVSKKTSFANNFIFKDVILLLKLGMPEMFMRLTPMIISFFMTQGIMGLYGAKGLALFSVVDKLRTIVGQICAPLVASYLAERDSNKNNWMINKLIIFFVLLIGAIIAISYMAAPWAVKILRLSDIDGAIKIWRVATLCLLGEACYQLCGAISAKKQKRRTWLQVIIAMAWAIFGSFIVYYLMIPIGIDVAIFGVACWQIIAGIIFIVGYRKLLG